MGYYNIVDEDESFPSQEFSEHTGLEWLYVQWKLPMDADELGFMLRGANFKTVSKLFKSILKLNPQLKLFNDVKSKMAMYHICMGALSRFNIDDIAFFSYPNDRSNIIAYNYSNRFLKKKIENKTNFKQGIQWVMSPITLDRVIKELEISV